MAKRLDQHTHIFVDRSLDDDIMAESLVTKDEHCTNKYYNHPQKGVETWQQ